MPESSISLVYRCLSSDVDVLIVIVRTVEAIVADNSNQGARFDFLRDAQLDSNC